MAAKMRYMACVELTTSSKSHKQTGQYALGNTPQPRREWGQTIRRWWHAFRFGAWQHTRHAVAQSTPPRLRHLSANNLNHEHSFIQLTNY